jgi:hypothetical protein
MLSMPRIVRPDSDQVWLWKSVPPLNRPLAGPLSETKNRPKHLINSNYSQGGDWRENSLLLNYRAMEILRQ